MNTRRFPFVHRLCATTASIGTVAFLLGAAFTLAPSDAHAADPSERLAMCQRDAKNLLSRIERDPNTSSVYQLKINCIEGDESAAARKLPGFAEVRSAYAKALAIQKAAEVGAARESKLRDAESDRVGALSASQGDRFAEAITRAEGCVKTLDQVFAADPKLAAAPVDTFQGSGNAGSRVPARTLRAMCAKLVTDLKPKAEAAARAAQEADTQRLASVRESLDAAKKRLKEGEGLEKDKRSYAAIRANDAYKDASQLLSDVATNLERTDKAKTDPRVATMQTEVDALRPTLEANLRRVGPLADRDWTTWEKELIRRLSGARRQVFTREGGLPYWWTKSDLSDPQARLDAALVAPVWGYRNSNGCEVQYSFAAGTPVASRDCR